MSESPPQADAEAERAEWAPAGTDSDASTASSGASSVDRRAYGMFRALPIPDGGRERGGGGGSEGSESDAGSEYDAAVAYLAGVR
jgi:hypothetical protein